MLSRPNASCSKTCEEVGLGRAYKGQDKFRHRVRDQTSCLLVARGQKQRWEAAEYLPWKAPSYFLRNQQISWANMVRDWERRLITLTYKICLQTSRFAQLLTQASAALYSWRAKGGQKEESNVCQSYKLFGFSDPGFVSGMLEEGCWRKIEGRKGCNDEAMDYISYSCLYVFGYVWV